MTPLYQNILNQPKSLEGVAGYQLGAGRPALIEAARLMRGARQVVLTGMGSSFFACFPLSCYLATHGIPARMVETSELLHFGRKTLKPDSVLVLVSRSGESVEAIRLLEFLRAERVPVIGVTNEEGGTLARQVANPILVGSARDELVAVQTYTGTLATLLLLGAAVTGELDRRAPDLARASAEMARCLERCALESQLWREFLDTPAPVYLLGRGASLASVFEGSLLLQEVSKTPAIGMSAGQFRHGPVEVVGAAFRGIVFGSQAATSELDVALARDLVRMGGKVGHVGHVGWSGPASRDPNGFVLCDWPSEVSDLFAPLLEIAPVMFASYRLAEWRGISPGQFRFATLVTGSEVAFS
jgi:glutamine---fructose-6-phosphate transaminase (isomerizing)